MKAAKRSPSPRTGGRPSVAQAEQLRGLILETAQALFLTNGYGATSIDAIAAKAGIAKRTFYSRFKDKAELFGAVLQHMIDGMDQSQHAPFSRNKECAEVLAQYAKAILHAVLLPQSLALYRVLLSESARFPELAAKMDETGARREAIRRIADLLQHHSDQPRARCEFGAEQFLHMVTAVPQRRALGLGVPMTREEYEQWAEDSVSLFLHGYFAKSA